MSQLVIRCVGLSKRFGEVLAVDEVHLEVEQGEVLFLVGPSGCGKTTILRLIAGFERPDAGSIDISGRVVADQRHMIPPEQRQVGMVFQDYALFPHMNVAQNVAFGLSHLSSSERAHVVDYILGLVGLADLKERYPHELSGGQQQRIALARALAPQPEVILLDEPFSNIDAALRARVRGEVREILTNAGATAVFVTHDQEEALSLGDKVAVMWKGRILQVDTPEQVYRSPATREVAQFVGDMDCLPGEATNGRVLCELGLLDYRGGISGAVDVFVQPESVRLVPAFDGKAEVVRREFFGHDQRYAVLLPSGRVIRARANADLVYELGQQVQVQVQDPVLVFPAAPGKQGFQGSDLSLGSPSTSE